MSDKDLNKLAAIEKAISEKYGEEAIQNPRANWDEDKEKEYLEQMRELYQKTTKHESFQEKIDVNGIKVSKKLFNRDSLQRCSVCSSLTKKTADDVCLLKFDCCYKCYIQYVEDREERWNTGWRPSNENNETPTKKHN
tara:strand:- start:8237 stop:8650 length:414 start_codon:yes stop_codon:yes gene_type:complete